MEPFACLCSARRLGKSKKQEEKKHMGARTNRDTHRATRPTGWRAKILAHFRRLIWRFSTSSGCELRPLGAAIGTNHRNTTTAQPCCKVCTRDRARKFDLHSGNLGEAWDCTQVFCPTTINQFAAAAAAAAAAKLPLAGCAEANRRRNCHQRRPNCPRVAPTPPRPKVVIECGSGGARH